VSGCFCGRTTVIEVRISISFEHIWSGFSKHIDLRSLTPHLCYLTHPFCEVEQGVDLARQDKLLQ
jgi:hypothetical protein